MQVGVFSYEQTLQSILPGEVTISVSVYMICNHSILYSIVHTYSHNFYVLYIYSMHWCVHDSVLQCNLYDQGEVEESAQFKTELERISCSKCCLLDGTSDFKQKVSLKGTNITKHMQCANTCLAPQPCSNL